MINLSAMSEVELLRTHGAVIDELMRRKVVRTRNNPIGDYTEWLVCNSLQLEIQNSSKASFDGIDSSGTRYQIKGRRSKSKNVQFSAIRNFHQNGFDFLIAVAFNEEYSIRFALKLTHSAVERYSKYRPHVNAHILMLDEAAINSEGIENIAWLLNGHP